MATLATDLLRTVARAFYPTEHILVIEALIIHSTLSDTDLAHVLGLQAKALRKLCGRLKEDGLLSIQTRSERRTDGSGGYFAPSGGGGPGGQQGKERMQNRDWYYLNYHRAIDSIKYRMHKLNKHIESLGAPTTEKKDLSCPQCKAQWTELEVMDRMDFTTGAFMCKRCGHPLDAVEEEDRAHENEGMKRLNSQLEKVLALMRRIDAASVPENDFEMALGGYKPIVRSDTNPGQAARTEVVDLPKHNLQSSKGLELKPEKLTVSLQNDEDVKRANAEAEATARREKEARQNMLPDWIAKSTVSGDITAVGAKEERERALREAHGGTLPLKDEDGEEKKPAAGGEEEMMAAYWAEMAKAQEAAAAAKNEEDEDDEDDEDEFEDVDVGGGNPPSTAPKPPPNGTTSSAANGNEHAISAPTSTGASTPAAAGPGESSTGSTDDEGEDGRAAKRPRLETSAPASAPEGGAADGVGVQKERAGGAGLEGPVEGTPAASDEDEDELEFENV